MSTIHIAIVDDEKEILDMLQRYLMRNPKYSVKTYQNPVVALENMDKNTNVVLLDIMMPQMNGLDLLPKLQERFPKIRVVMMTAYSTLDKVLNAHRSGAEHYVMKPFESLSVLESKIEEVAVR
jgi:DNA-binding NtrC family response regulator